MPLPPSHELRSSSTPAIASGVELSSSRELWSVGEFLAARAAENKKSSTPFLDACLIVAFSMGISKDRLLASLSDSADSIPGDFNLAWERRLAGESVASIIGEKEFYGRKFFVDQRVLIPRPDTEILVSTALELGDSRAAFVRSETGSSEVSVVDVCTGSGAIAISLAAERPEWSLWATDISQKALEVARLNSRRILGRELPMIQADLLEGIEKNPGSAAILGSGWDMIVSNPPYLLSSETEQLIADGWTEPPLALDGGPDGLVIVRRLIAQASAWLKPGGFLLIETDALQIEKVRVMFETEGFSEIRVWKDLAGLPRVSSGKAP